MRTIFTFLMCMFMSVNAYTFACETCHTDTNIGTEDPIITIDGVAIKEADFVKEYITQYEYNPESGKFIVHKCNQEKREKAAALVEKGHNHKRDGHGGVQVHGRERKRRFVQWFKCDVCGMYCKGPKAGYEHVQDTGHRMFHRV